MRRVSIASALILSLVVVGCRSIPLVRPDQPVVAIDSGGRPIAALQAGSSLELRAGGLTPRATYEFRVSLAGRPGEADTFLSLARTGTDAGGTVAPFILWYHSGVIGCATRPADERRPLKFRSFEEADAALRGRTLRITAQQVPRAERMSELVAGPAQGPVAFDMALPIETRRSPMVYPSDHTGCLVNSVLTESQDLWVSGRNFAPGEAVAISVVPNQRAWSVGDRVTDVTGPSSASAPKRVIADANGRFLVRGWDAANHRRGVYDIVAQRLEGRRGDLLQIDPGDIVSYGSDTGVILYSLYPIGGPTMDLAGRPLSGPPYFEYADSFADTGDSVWAAVDPTYVPAGHPGGMYAGYHVVAHRSVAGWDPGMGGSINIADVSSNGVEVMPVKAGCINASDIIIWPAPVPVGQYDVVVDFGTIPASSAAAYVPDGQYNAIPDFLDGADQIGFVVTKDPYVLGAIPIGSSSYSFDDFFPALGTATDVDLRAVVRYPAVSTGVDTTVAAGTHPLFVIQHGNHGICRVCTDATLYYDRLKEAVNGVISWSTFQTLCSYTWATCPDRTKNHEGYMRLLEILASHGIIAVSIDAYDLSGAMASGWIDERANLILKHLELWAHANDPSQFPTYPDPFGGRFAGKVDMTKISVSGHSRGGEASVRAYLNNASLPTPFSINSVSSIAPVDFHGSVLPAVPYFVILPAADGDVQSLSGAPIYDRAGSGVADATTKAGIWVYGANHNFFNTVWAADWDDWTDSHPSWPARPDFIPPADQQTLGEAYLSAFARVYLKNETVYEDMLRGNLTFPSTAGRKIYHFRHETQHAKLDAGTAAGVASGGLTSASVANPSVHQTQAVRLGWGSSAAVYTYAVPNLDVSIYEVLSFRAAQTNAATNPASGSQDFEVELVGGGHTKAVFMGKFDAVPKPYDRVGADHNVMTTVRIPLHSFIINQSGVTLNNVDTVRFRFLSPTAGEIYVDDVEFSR